MQMIKMHEVIVLELGAMQQVSDKPCILGDLNVNRVFDCPHRGQSMCVRSDTAGALDKMVGIPGVAPLQDKLNPSEHLSGTPGIFYFTTLDFNFDAKVAFYSGNWIYCNSRTHIISSVLLQKSLLQIQCEASYISS